MRGNWWFYIIQSMAVNNLKIQKISINLKDENNPEYIFWISINMFLCSLYEAVHWAMYVPVPAIAKLKSLF